MKLKNLNLVELKAQEMNKINGGYRYSWYQAPWLVLKKAAKSYNNNGG